MMRNLSFENEWFAEAARSAGNYEPEDFLTELAKRFRKGAESYGEDAWLGRTFTELIENAREEGVDLPAWLVLARQIIDRNYRDRLSPEAIDHLHRILIEAAAQAIKAWQMVDIALEFFDEEIAKERVPVLNGRPFSHGFEE